jgi:tetratricopeptide (TPR) repeat protein
MAYEYSSEGRWKKAIALYEEAAEIHRVVGPREYYANARANYWTCRFDRGDMRAANIAQLKKELEEIIEILGGSYFERQPLILQARIEEWRGDLTEAIRFAEKAVHAGPKGTRYPEKDRAYVETLRRKSKQI